LFKIIARQSTAPKWNFYKYVVDRKGQVIANFSSLTKPDDPEFITAVEKALASQP
jgi:glutathione peroxidase